MARVAVRAHKATASRVDRDAGAAGVGQVVNQSVEHQFLRHGRAESLHQTLERAAIRGGRCETHPPKHPTKRSGIEAPRQRVIPLLKVAENLNSRIIKVAVVVDLPS